jgi:steroid 5-alpha reductase family enzyme
MRVFEQTTDRCGRHPNFACEISFWVTFYLWACFQTDVYLSWVAAGAFSYVALFAGSTWFTEKISVGKYPEYKEYQKTTGKLLPGVLLNKLF